MNSSELEQKIIAQIRLKDPEGLTLLAQHFGPLLRYVIRPLLPSEEDREECLSDVLLKVWEKADSFDPQRGSLKSWLTAVARNTALDKAKSAAQTAAKEELPENLPSPAVGPEEEMLQKERERAVRTAVEALPERDRVLIYRYYYYRQPLGQIAAETGLSLRAVEGKLYRIRQKLRRRLEEEVK